MTAVSTYESSCEDVPVFPSAVNLRHSLAAKAAVPFDWLLPSFYDQAFGILTYHRIAPGLPAGPNLCVSPDQLELQLTGLLERGYRPTSLRELLQCHRQGKNYPEQAFVICFDDGYAGVHQHALPILKRLGAPATVFLPTGHIDTKGARPFDPWGLEHPESPEEALRIVTTNECLEMQDSGLIELGCHTHMHEDMRDRLGDFCSDMEASVTLLESRFGVKNPLFSFPFGMTGSHMRSVVKEYGVSCALTTDCQLVTPGDDPYNWGRLGAEQYDTAATLAAKLRGTYSVIQNAYRRLKLAVGCGPPAHLMDEEPSPLEHS